MSRTEVCCRALKAVRYTMYDLFHQAAPQPLPLPDGELLLFDQPALPQPPATLLELLIATIEWRQETVTLYGKTHLQPRLIAWHGDPQASYRYSGKTYQPLPWIPILTELRTAVQSTCGASFNSVLLNYYRDGRDSMGLHADDEPELGPQPVIASLSLGVTRTLYFKHKHRAEQKNYQLPLHSGSLLLMRGATQQNWKHGIRKLSRSCGPRVNLTFRKILS